MGGDCNPIFEYIQKQKNRLEQINELIYIKEKGIIIYIQNTTNPLFRVHEQYNFRAI